MTWDEIAVRSLRSAKSLWKDDPRSSSSRAYYSAHVALAGRLVSGGYVPPRGRQTQPHGGQSRLVRTHLATLSPGTARRLSSAMSRLYGRRIDADYRRTVTVDEQAALDSLRDAASVLQALRVQ